MNMIKKNTASRLTRSGRCSSWARRTAVPRIVQTVIVLGFAVGLGAALLLLQGNIQTAITKAGTSVTDMFSKITSGAA